MSCWVCGGDPVPFYSLTSIPTSTVVLHTDRAAALAQPRADLSLAACPDCGFIQNSAFDPDLVDYDAPYEPSQAASPTFREFAGSTIDRLARRYSLSGGVVIDVGCGKAEWLALCCRLAGMSGIGIDPAYTPGQVPAEDRGRFEVIVDRFGPDTDLTGNLVACRHTLEHLSNPLDFTIWLAGAAGRTPGSVLFIEVPDTGRILSEGAFWDIYYEHCSYFTASSLENLAHLAGLEVLDLRTAFSDQYLLLEASPGAEPSPVSGGGPVVAAAQDFSERAAKARAAWTARLAGVDSLVLWAATSKTVAFLEATGADPVAVVDINPSKWGSFLPGSGIEVIPPEELVAVDPDLVVAMNPIYLEEIGSQLAAIGIATKLVGLDDRGHSDR